MKELEAVPGAEEGDTNEAALEEEEEVDAEEAEMEAKEKQYQYSKLLHVI